MQNSACRKQNSVIPIRNYTSVPQGALLRNKNNRTLNTFMPLSESHNGSTNENYIIQMIFLFRQFRFLHKEGRLQLDYLQIAFAGPLERLEEKFRIESSFIDIQSKVLLHSDHIDWKLTDRSRFHFITVVFYLQNRPFNEVAHQYCLISWSRLKWISSIRLIWGNPFLGKRAIDMRARRSCKANSVACDRVITCCSST